MNALLMTKTSFTTELENFLRRVFTLPETASVTIRDVVISRGGLTPALVTEAAEKSYHDFCSDVDLSISVWLNPADSILPEHYLRRLDRYGVDASHCLGFVLQPEHRQCRVVMNAGMRYDLGFTFLFDPKAPRLSLDESSAGESPWPTEKVNAFWFVQIQALGKLYRRDYLISDHLANMNLNETLVQQMVLRDMEYGTNHHRYGHEEDLAYLSNQHKCPVQTGDVAFDRIADKLWCAALTYDQLTSRFYPEYKPRSDRFLSIWQDYETGRPSLPE